MTAQRYSRGTTGETMSLIDRSEGVDTSRVRRFQDYHTGLYLREQVGPAPVWN